MNQFLYYISIFILASGGLSLFLFFSWQKNPLLAKRPFFSHWMFGFALYALVHAPVIIINTFDSTVDQISFYYVISFFAGLGATLLFYRGVLYLLNPNRFWLNKFPIIWGVVGGIIILGLYFGLGASVSFVSFVYGLIFNLPLSLFLGIILLRLSLTKKCFIDKTLGGKGLLILSMGWFLIFVLNILKMWRFWQIQPTIETIPAQMITFQFQMWYLGQAVAILMILYGILYLYHNCLPYLKKYKAD